MLWSEMERLGRFMSPWRELDPMGRALTGLATSPAVEFPAVNIWVSGDEAMVTAELPGVGPDGIEISVVGKTLVLRGSRDLEETKERESYHRRERWHGQFSKTIGMPFAIEAGKVDARFSRGVLRITLPRAEAERPRKISIKAE